MKLRYSPTSPYVRKVCAVALETGLHDQIERVVTDPWDSATSLPAQNPLGKVPALELDDGTALFDSPLICEYLDSLHDSTPLIPADGDDRWRALRLEACADGILDAAISRLFEGRRPADRQWDVWRERQRVAVQRGLAWLEANVDGFGAVTIGTLAVGCALGYLDLRFAADDWRAGQPRLAEWYAPFSQRDSLRLTAPPQ